jgi:hypothetical protein
VDPKRVRTADGRKAVAELQSVKETLRQRFELVGADRKPVARLRQALQHRLKLGKGPRSVGDMLAIVGHK